MADPIENQNGNGKHNPANQAQDKPIDQEEQALLKTVNDDVELIGDYLKEVAQGIKENKISNYPIFVVHKEEYLPLGKMIINAEMTKTNWSFNASFAEDLVSKEVLQADRFDDFQKVYKTKENHACLFVVSKTLQKFIFSPYPEEDQES